MSASKKLPANFVHFRCASQLTEALDRVAEEHGITRSEATRLILELHLFDDTRAIAVAEGISHVRRAIKVAGARAFESYKLTFAEALEEALPLIDNPQGGVSPGKYGGRGSRDGLYPPAHDDGEEDEGPEPLLIGPG